MPKRKFYPSWTKIYQRKLHGSALKPWWKSCRLAWISRSMFSVLMPAVIHTGRPIKRFDRIPLCCAKYWIWTWTRRPSRRIIAVRVAGNLQPIRLRKQFHPIPLEHSKESLMKKAALSCLVLALILAACAPAAKAAWSFRCLFQGKGRRRSRL